MAITPNNVQRSSFKSTGFKSTEFKQAAIQPNSINGKSAVQSSTPSATATQNCECPPGLGGPDPIESTRLNLEASRRTPKKPASPQVVPVKVDRVGKDGIYVKAGGGGVIPLKGLSNGSVSVGQVLLAQVSEGFGAAATWMPR